VPSAKRAILFADVCDSTALYESIGDAQALALINRLFAQLDKRVKAAGGSVVKTLGDGMVCQFHEPDAAFNAACAMQAAAIGMNAPGEHKLRLKIGYTYGAVVLKGDDVFGDTVNLSARLVSHANPEQVLTTRETVDALSEALRKRCRELFDTKVRGRVGQVKMWEVLWREDPDVTQVKLSKASLARANQWVLKVTYDGESFTVEAGSEVRIGRDKANQVVVPSEHASRQHARLFGREGNFVIADSSSNGTFVMVEGNTRELRLRREEAIIGERGAIGLGASTHSKGDHVLRYQLQRRGGGARGG
jgi:adenylate cyclase